MSVGHTARALEEAGLPTVIIAAKSFRTRMEMMALPRVLLTDTIMGRVLGNPNDGTTQLARVQQALSLLESAEVRTIIDEEAGA